MSRYPEHCLRPRRDWHGVVPVVSDSESRSLNPSVNGIVLVCVVLKLSLGSAGGAWRVVSGLSVLGHESTALVWSVLICE